MNPCLRAVCAEQHGVFTRRQAAATGCSERELKTRTETQFIAVEPGRRAEVDLRVGRHLFEFDGKVKYLGREQGGAVRAGSRGDQAALGVGARTVGSAVRPPRLNRLPNAAAYQRLRS